MQKSKPISRSNIQQRHDVAHILAARGDDESNRQKAKDLDIMDEFIKALPFYKESEHATS